MESPQAVQKMLSLVQQSKIKVSENGLRNEVVEEFKYDRTENTSHICRNVVHPHLLTLLTNRILLVDHQEWDKLRPLMIHEYSIHLDYPREVWGVKSY